MKESGSRWQLKLLSLGGLLLVAGALVALNYLSSRANARVDLTQGKVYTLSEGTRNILAKLDSPVRIRWFATQGEQVPVQLRAFARRVEDLLDEYRVAGKGNVIVEKFDPQPDSDAEDAARLDGIQGQQLQSGETIYLGLSVGQLDQKVAIPFLSPDRERLLEYDISRAIAGATTTKKPVIGVMTGLPIWGGNNPMTGPTEPWYVGQELRRDYEVRQIALDAAKIDDDVKALVLVHPRGVTGAAMFAIDQYVLRGGKLVAFLDGLSYFDPRGPATGMPGSGSTLEPLLKAWGLALEPERVVADPSIMFGRGVQATTTLLSIAGDLVDPNDVATSQVQSVLLAFSGAFTGTPAAGLAQTVLMRTSANAGFVDAMAATQPGMGALKDFKPAGSPLPLAVRLTGRFKTAFPEGAPKARAGETPPGAPKPPAVDPGPHVKEGAADNTVVLVGDADLLANEVALQVAEVFGQRVFVPRNDNLSFALSLVEQMAGDSNLTTLRSRASFTRPFIRVNEMEARAAAGYRDKLKELEDGLTQTRNKLTELQSRAPGQKAAVTAEQQAEIDKFRKTESQIRADLKTLRKELRHDIDSLEWWTKVANIVAMPLLVAVVGIGVALVRRRRAVAS
jgi:ABC-type uncharacterized transport system involved in gliding motility auxiliary subunit